jgi:hypothetical protein
MLSYIKITQRPYQVKVIHSVPSDFQRHVYGPEGERDAKRNNNGLRVAQEDSQKEKVLYFCARISRTSGGLVILDKYGEIFEREDQDFGAKVVQE